MSLRDASPEADTTSYPPVFIRFTASSEVPKYFTLAWQPVAFSNGVTQSTLGSLEPSSAYPGQARMLTVPSIAPRDFCMGMFGGVKPWPPGVPAAPLEPADVPQPATSARAATPSTAPSGRSF